VIGVFKSKESLKFFDLLRNNDWIVFSNFLGPHLSVDENEHN